MRDGNEINTCGNSWPQIAFLGFEGIANKAAALCPPGIFDGGVLIMGNQFHDLVLEPLALVVREWQVVRIGTDPQFARLHRQSSKKEQGGYRWGPSHCGVPDILSVGAGGGVGRV